MAKTGGIFRGLGLSKEQQQAAAALGINKVNKGDELNRINNYVAAAQQSRSNPVYQQTAQNLGITNYNSVNDYAQVVNAMAAPSPAAPAPAPQQQQQRSAPAPSSPSGGGGGGGGSSAPAGPDYAAMLEQFKIQSQQQIADLQAQSQAQMAEMTKMFQAQMKASEMARLQEMERLKETQKVYAMNQARADAAGNLQIQGAGGDTGIGGTDPFKIRRRSGGLVGAAAPLMLSTTLNI